MSHYTGTPYYEKEILNVLLNIYVCATYSCPCPYQKCPFSALGSIPWNPLLTYDSINSWSSHCCCNWDSWWLDCQNLQLTPQRDTSTRKQLSNRTELSWATVSLPEQQEVTGSLEVEQCLLILCAYYLHLCGMPTPEWKLTSGLTPQFMSSDTTKDPSWIDRSENSGTSQSGCDTIPTLEKEEIRALGSDLLFRGITKDLTSSRRSQNLLEMAIHYYLVLDLV